MDEERNYVRINGICIDGRIGYVSEIEPTEYVTCDTPIEEVCVPNIPTQTCDCCGETVPVNRLNICIGGNFICNNCYNMGEQFVRCDRCGIVINTEEDDFHENYGDYFCNDCYLMLNKSTYGQVLGYHRFDDWHFKYAKDEKPHNLVTGIELEVEHVNYCNESTNDIVWNLNKMLGFNTICSRDGSINDGFEIVSQPFSLAFIRENEKTIKEALKYLIDHGYRGDQVSTCGLHLHINREAFGETSKEQNKNIDKLILFFETYKQELFRFSRRSANKLQRWAKFLSDYKHVNVDSDTDSAKRLKSLEYIGKTKSSVEERYCAVNLMNDDTVEIRIFKSSLNYKTLFATIELIHTLVRRIVNSESLEDFSWNNVVNDGDCRYLKEYCDLRGISTDKELIDYSDWYKETMLERNKMTMQNLIKRTESLLRRMSKYYNRKTLDYVRLQNSNLHALTSWLNKVNSTFCETTTLGTKENEYNYCRQLVCALREFKDENLSQNRVVLQTYRKEINSLYKMIGRIEEECV